MKIAMDRQRVAKTWVYRGLCDLYFAFDNDDPAFENNAKFSEIMGLEKFLKAILLYEQHTKYEALPLSEARAEINKMAMNLGHKFTKMIKSLSDSGLIDFDRIKQSDFDGYDGSQLIQAVEAGYMETRYPVPQLISDKFPIEGTDLTHDPLSSSGLTKFIYALCNACYLRLASNIDFTQMLDQFRNTFQEKESFGRFNNLFWQIK